MKVLPITKQTAQALSNGADTILVPVDERYQDYIFDKIIKDDIVFKRYIGGCIATNEYLELPIKVGDKFQAIWVDTTFTYNGFFGTKTIYEHEAVSIEIIQATMIEYEDAVSISQGDGADFMSWVDEQHGDGFYSSNRYVALIKTKELTDEAMHIK